MKTIVSVSIDVTLLLILLTGCTKHQTVIYNQPEIKRDGYYEIAWIDPQIVFSDTLYTLIRSERIDSFFVKQPEDLLDETIPSLRITITPESCFTSINLLNETGIIIKPLFARRLQRGYYKFTSNVERINAYISSTGIYYIKADYCNFSVIERIAQQQQIPR